MNNQRSLLTVKEVAEMLRVNKGSIYALIHSGVLNAIKFGTYKVPAFEVDNFIHHYSNCDLTDLNNIKTLVVKGEVQNGISI